MTTAELLDADAVAAWPQLLDYRVELGFDGKFTDAALSRWDRTTWDEGRWVWGMSADWQLLDKATVLGIAVEGGADVLTTAMPAQSATVQLWNRDGRYAPSGEGWWLAAQLRISVSVLGGPHRLIFHGYIEEPTNAGTPTVPVVTLRAYDALSVWAAARVPSTVGDVLQSMSDRLEAIADALDWPEAGRDFEPDDTLLIGDATSGALDMATRSTSSTGGVLWAEPGDPYGTVTYRTAAWLADRELEVPRLAVVVGDASSAPAGVPVAVPTEFTGTMRLGQVENHISWRTQAQVPLEATADDLDSRARFGWRSADPLSDLLNAEQASLDARVQLQLARNAWPRPYVAPLEVTVYNATTAQAAALRFGDVIYVAADHHGAQYGFLAMCGGVEHRVTADRWTVGLHAVSLHSIPLP